MTHKSKPDEDTTTGLPRKLGWRVATWSLGLLQAIALGCLVHLQNSLEKTSNDLADVRVRVARIEGMLKMMAFNPLPAVSVTAKDPVAIQ